MSLEVPSGTYHRTYSYADASSYADPATVTGFRLDKYLVTVGRFRQFVTAWNGGAGYAPPAGAGKHAHLNGGMGLANSGSPGAYEPGWLTSDDANIAPTSANLACGPPYDTWTDSPGSQEGLPINCTNWYEAYAFCIWDGGFLPSEAEWELAAAGGDQQRAYPWGSAGLTDGGFSNQYAVYGCNYPDGSTVCSGVANIAPVGSAPLGAGLSGQLDLAGDMFEWNLDWYAPYVTPCVDCAFLTASSYRVVRGDGFDFPATYLPPMTRIGNVTAAARGTYLGFRCARTP